VATPRDLRGPLISVSATGAALTAAMGALGTGRSAWSTGVGALVAVANLYVLGRVVGATLGTGGGAAWRILGGMKMLILFAAVWLLLTSRLVDPIPFVVGLGALPIGLVTGSLVPGFVAGDYGREAPGSDPKPPQKPDAKPED
jgi:hypothetical protein